MARNTLKCNHFDTTRLERVKPCQMIGWEIIPEVTYNVSSGTLNPTAPFIYTYTTSCLNLSYFYLDVFDLYQRPSSEEACSVLLPVLATVVLARTGSIKHICGKNRKKNRTSFFWRRSLIEMENFKVIICQVEIWSSVYIYIQGGPKNRTVFWQFVTPVYVDIE